MHTILVASTGDLASQRAFGSNRPVAHARLDQCFPNRARFIASEDRRLNGYTLHPGRRSAAAQRRCAPFGSFVCRTCGASPVYGARRFHH